MVHDFYDTDEEISMDYIRKEITPFLIYVLISHLHIENPEI